MTSLRVRRTIAALAASVAWALVPAAAQAAYPGGNGKIAFVRGGQVWTMNADGTGETQLTSAATVSTDPSWSPDGRKIVFTRQSSPDPEIWVMNGDGTNQARIKIDGYDPTWSPDGAQIAYVRHWLDDQPPDPSYWEFWELHIMNADGANDSVVITSGSSNQETIESPAWSVGAFPNGERIAISWTGFDWPVMNIHTLGVRGGSGAGQLTTSGNEHAPAWAPDGSRLAFGSQRDGNGEIYTMNDDGSDEVNRTNTAVSEGAPEWAPNGTKIVFAGETPGCRPNCNSDLWTMNPDGTGRTRLTNTAADEGGPSWQPVFDDTPGGYPRPKGATPVLVSLVPAFKQCTQPNSTHGAPLSAPSCNPPARASANARVGYPGDPENPAVNMAANMVGKVRLDTIAGDPATSGDEADLSIRVNVTDVRSNYTTCPGCPGGNENYGWADYFGTLTAALRIRITDRVNGSSGTAPGTRVDMPLPFRVPCSSTSDQTIGSTCATTTTADTLAPGAIKEGARTIWDLLRTDVFDGTAGLRTDADNTLFLTQGVFVP